MQARVSQSRMKKGGLPLGYRPKKNMRCKLEAVKKRHELEAARQFSTSHVCNGSSALVVRNVENCQKPEDRALEKLRATTRNVYSGPKGKLVFQSLDSKL